MPHAIVLLDLVRFSKLSPTGQEAVFTEFIPVVKECVPTNARELVDANTWGDAIVLVYQTALGAAQAATAIRNLIETQNWKETELKNLSVRIAVHVADLSQGSDAIRDLKGSGPHVYGTGMVVPARVEPRVREGSIWLTDEAAPHVKRAIDDEKLRGWRVEPLGTLELPKAGGIRQVHWLGRSTEEKPNPIQPDRVREQTGEILRLRSLQEIVEIVDLFRARRRRLRSRATVTRAFADAHNEALLALKLPASGEALEAHVLSLRRSGELVSELTATSRDHEGWVPQMGVTFTSHGKVRKPGRHAGLAPHCVWQTASGRPGVGVVRDVRASLEATYFTADRGAVGGYTSESFPDVYKRAERQDGTQPPYVSLMATAVLLPSGQGRRFECVGVLNVTSTRPDAFTAADYAWLEAASSTLGSLYALR